VATNALPRWTRSLHVPGVVDLAIPRRNGSITVTAAGRLALVSGGRLIPFARGARGYVASPGDEPYVALSTGRSSPHEACSFASDVLYALKLGKAPGVVSVDARGRVHRFVRLPTHGALTGIAFDVTGRFGGRLLVTATAGNATSVFAVDCRQHVARLTETAPRVEGGIAVASATFGQFAGYLIAPDENSGRIYAIAPNGTATVLAASGLAHGGDIGVESVGFLPAGFGPGWSALVSDRGTPGDPHPGDDAILALKAEPLLAEGVRSGDLLVATEGGAQTDAIRCSNTCTVRHVADGRAVAHVEGRIVFTGGR
jgi:hypothetical protein